jgi:antitoxin CptB
MDENPDERRKRVRFRSHHTGMKENDLLFGAFADERLLGMSDEDVAWFESLLMDNNDLDLNAWITGKEPYPPHLDHPVMHALCQFQYTFKP